MTDIFLLCTKCPIERTQIQKALEYLPSSVTEKWQKGKVAIVTMNSRLGLRLDEDIRKQYEIVILSERVFPKYGLTEEKSTYRHFIFVVLHEIAHIYLDHASSERCEELNENEAHKKAKEWYDEHARLLGFRELCLGKMTEIHNKTDIEYDNASWAVKKKLSLHFLLLV